ncbi:glucoamylase [Phaffia rhodozyma]|uniref:glucan 1,4-alpha-glucosidase n=1 Tax=Phaffia rhodozyma TaxID=264483 RepID=A0A0F7SQH6_PHARH|nr:glucoamylase [Phaffia rhodozyma]
MPTDKPSLLPVTNQTNEKHSSGPTYHLSVKTCDVIDPDYGRAGPSTRHAKSHLKGLLSLGAVTSVALVVLASSSDTACLSSAISRLPSTSSVSSVVRWATGYDSSVHELRYQDEACRHRPQETSLEIDDWIDEERDISHRAILDNIGPRAGAIPGLVIASPSKSHPDYFYSWTRDSALTFSTIFDRFLPGPNSTAYAHGDPSLEPLIREYIHAQGNLQLLSNPSGTFLDGGLGEPKFEVDGTAFHNSWGRPQRDGPPLRAMVVSQYAEYLLDRKEPFDSTYINENIYNPKTVMAKGSILKSDLEYTAHNWHRNSFDLWEEINGLHFFTLLASRVALERGAALATRLSDPGAASFYTQEANAITDRLELFWSPDRNFISATIDAPRFGRSGLDSALILAFLHAGEQGDGVWGIAGERALSTLISYVDSFKNGLYKINDVPGDGWNGAIAVGRYSEDVYNGDGMSLANPWYLCTFGVAEMIFRIAIHFEKVDQIPITPISLHFWQNVYPSAKSGDVYQRGDGVYEHVLEKLAGWADGFLLIGKSFEGPEGSFTEQFSRLDGTPTGAKKLTWSYASFIEATNGRNEYRHISALKRD